MHVAHLMWKDESNQLRTRKYIHVLEPTEQGADAAIAILTHVLQLVKLELPTVTIAHIRSDNGASYHSSATIGAVPIISLKTGIWIETWHFSEAQSGRPLSVNSL